MGVPSEPGSASAARGYGRSRKGRQRFEYSETSRAGFVELAPDRLLTEQEIYDALKKVPEVAIVAWKEAKTSQGNGGFHYMERNIKVFVPGSANTPIEFELTRNQHMKDVSWRPYTLTACFKEPPSTCTTTRGASSCTSSSGGSSCPCTPRTTASEHWPGRPRRRPMRASRSMHHRVTPLRRAEAQAHPTSRAARSRRPRSMGQALPAQRRGTLHSRCARVGLHNNRPQAVSSRHGRTHFQFRINMTPWPRLRRPRRCCRRRRRGL